MLRIVGMVIVLAGYAAFALAADYKYVEPAQFRDWLVQGKDMAIVDIQVPAEFQQHHFKGALETNAYPVKTPAEKQRLDAIVPKLATGGNDVVIICPRGGGGAKNSVDYLKGKGIDEKRIFILKEGMQRWPYPDLSIGAK